MNVALVDCLSYDLDTVSASVDLLFEMLGGIDKFVKKGQKVLLKANMVRQMSPDKAATTHPALLAAIAKKIISETGAEVVIGDSPGGLYTSQHMSSVYRICGINEACEMSGAKINNDFGYHEVIVDGKVIKKMECIDAFLDADVVINVCKFKTHSLTGFSGCVKNLFGLIPGLLKVEMHTRFSDLNPFCDALLDIEGFAKNKICLHVMDAVVGMHKNGPTAGDPIAINKLIAGENPHYVDIVAQHMFCDPHEMPVVMKEIERGLVSETFDEIDCGCPLEQIEKISGFIPVESVGSMSLYRYPKFVRKFIKNISSQKVKIKKDMCKGCGKCAVHCPNKAISIENNKAHIKQSQCIRCYCCQELCPFLAVGLTKPFGYRLFRRLSGRSRRNKNN